MKKAIGLTLFLMMLTINSNAQQVVKLWGDNPSVSSGLQGEEKWERDGAWVTNISIPEIHIYLPDAAKNTGAAVIICPGGGYGGLAFDHEGIQFAKWLNDRGIAGVILKYRMPNKHKDIPIADARRAIYYIRENADKLAINAGKVGVAGFSAGGHLAATLSTWVKSEVEGISERPDFSILFYPVITMKALTHGGSRNALLGNNPSEEDVLAFSTEEQVSPFTPQTILLLSNDDKSVVPQNSVSYYEALKKNNIPATMYIFPEGGHGWGMRENFKYNKQMLELLDMWLKDVIK